MGFGKGKGFTTIVEVVVKVITYRVVAVQGAQPVLTETNPTYTTSVS